jgi:AraC family transcriptional regulator, ethanolamine operon transcriptional activator
MSRHAFRDFDEFADSIEGIAGRFVPTKPSADEWWVEAAPAGRVSLQQVQIGGAATFAGDGEVGCFTIGIPMTNPDCIHIDGRVLDARSFLFLKQRQPFTFAGEDATRWAGITVPLGHDLLAQEIIDASQSQSSACTRTHLQHIVRLRGLAEMLCNPGKMINVSTPLTAAAAEQEIVVHVSRALESSSQAREPHVGRFHYPRQRVIARTLELIHASGGQPLHIADLCAATEVSERTLRNVFNEYFGVGPMRLLKMRQLREIRAALEIADPARDTVANIAERFGVWDFSLFARNYKKLFGESPSLTLRTPPGKSKVKDNLSWLDCALRIFLEDMRPAAMPPPRPPSGVSDRL